MSTTPVDTSNNVTRDELYQRASEREIDGRSNMSKDELRDALRQASDSTPTVRVVSRVESFRVLAEQAAKGRFVMLPRMLRGNDRRLHIRQTLREHHQTRIAAHSADTSVKFERLAESLQCGCFVSVIARQDGATLPATVVLCAAHFCFDEIIISGN